MKVYSCMGINNTLSAGEDITILNISSVIPPGVSEACLQLLATDDEIVEDDEVFTVMVKAGNPNDKVNGTASVVISDNDGIHTETFCTLEPT